MIKFSSKTAQTEELKETVQDALIDCISHAVNPLWGKYTSEYDEFGTEEEKHRKFVENAFEIMVDMKVLSDGTVQVDDYFTDEGYRTDDSYHLENAIKTVKQKYPDLIVAGEGEIDFAHVLEEYSITTDGNSIHLEYSYDDGYTEEFDIDVDGIQGSDSEEEEFDDNDDEWDDREHHFTDIMPKMTCSGKAEIVKALIEYGDEKKEQIMFDTEKSFAFYKDGNYLIGEPNVLLVYTPVSIEATNEAKSVDFSFESDIKGLLFAYEANGEYQTDTDKMIAISAVKNEPNNEWKCLKQEYSNVLGEFFSISIAANMYVQEFNMYETYSAMDEWTTLDFYVKDGELMARELDFADIFEAWHS